MLPLKIGDQFVRGRAIGRPPEQHREKGEVPKKTLKENRFPCKSFSATPAVWDARVGVVFRLVSQSRFICLHHVYVVKGQPRLRGAPQRPAYDVSAKLLQDEQRYAQPFAQAGEAFEKVKKLLEHSDTQREREKEGKSSGVLWHAKLMKRINAGPRSWRAGGGGGRVVPKSFHPRERGPPARVGGSPADGKEEAPPK